MEETTTAHYTANQVHLSCMHDGHVYVCYSNVYQVQLAIFPVSISYTLPGDETPRKGGICFISSDLVHDFSQVARMERRVFSYLKEKYGVVPTVWHRWSDNCAGQARHPKLKIINFYF